MAPNDVFRHVSNKRPLGGGALIRGGGETNYENWIPRGALIRGGFLTEGGAYEKFYCKEFGYSPIVFIVFQTLVVN